MEELHDEDRQIKKLEEHRDLKKLFLEIGQLNGIEVKPTTNNDKDGDFVYPSDQHETYIEGLDVYLAHKKVKSC